MFVEGLLCARSPRAGPLLPTPPFPCDLIFHLCLQPLPPTPFYNKGIGMTMTVALASHLAGEGKWDTNSGNLLLLMRAAWLNSFQVLLIKINRPGRFCQRKHPRLQAHGRLKMDVLRVASETLIFAFLTSEL